MASDGAAPTAAELVAEVPASDQESPVPPEPIVAVVTAAAPTPAVVMVAATPMSVASTEPRSSERGSRGKRGKPPFRLCFTVPGVAGRAAPSALACTPANAVAGKFYSREEEKITAALQAAVDALGDAGEWQPRGREQLESFRYGQYPRPLVPPRLADRRLHFAFRTSEMVRVQCQIARAGAAATAATTPHGHRGRQSTVPDIS